MIERILPQVHLKRRSDIHLARKVWHVITVFLMFLVYLYASDFTSKTILVVSSLICVPADILRLKFKPLNEFFIHFFKPVLRMSEVHRLAGTTYLLCGVLIVVFTMPRPIVALTVLFLAFADPIASYVGIRYGKDKIFGQKTIQGFIGAYFACFFCSFFFLYSSTIPQDRLLVFSLLAGFVGALAELLPIGDLDDNLTLPVLSAGGLYVLFFFFGFLESYP